MSTREEDVIESYERQVILRRGSSMIRRSSSNKTSYVPLIISAIAGIVFGFAIEKSRVFEPHIIREQMLLSNFTMLKMFLTAAAVGMLSFSWLSLIPATRDLLEDVVDEMIQSHVSKSVASAAVGGALLGCGMTLSGACPGMVMAQVGAGVPGAVLTLLGGFCAAFLFGLTERSLRKWIQSKDTYFYYTLDEYLDTPYSSIALPLASILGTVVFSIEVFRPWTTEVELTGDGVLTTRSWPPYVAGAIVGLLQTPIVLSVQKTLGTSTSYMTLASQALVIKRLRSVFPHLTKFQQGVNNWWQVFYVSGAVIGAYLSSSASGTFGTTNGVDSLHCFLGGVFMIFGARVAGGCSSGHGLSGMGLLMLLSFVAVPSMFAGGISTAFFMKNVLQVTDFPSPTPSPTPLPE